MGRVSALVHSNTQGTVQNFHLRTPKKWFREKQPMIRTKPGLKRERVAKKYVVTYAVEKTQVVNIKLNS
jgi:hypothetical protein